MQNRAKTCKNVQKRASQIFLDPIQKRAPARSVQLEAVYLEALLYFVMEHLKEVDSQSLDVIGPNNFEHNRGCDHLVNVDYTGL